MLLRIFGFHYDEKVQPKLHRNNEGTKILKSNVESAKTNLNRNKEERPGGIVIDMLATLNDFGIDKITDIIKDIYNGGDIPEDIIRSIFIALAKNPDAIECRLHWTISLTRHLPKLTIRGLMNIARSRMRPEIGGEQYVITICLND